MGSLSSTHSLALANARLEIVKKGVAALKASVVELLNTAQEQEPTPDLPPSPAPASRPRSDGVGLYDGPIEFGIAQGGDQFVPTIYDVLAEFESCEALGFCKVRVGDDLFNSVDVDKLGNSTIASQGYFTNVMRGWAPDANLRSLACSVTIEGRRTRFKVPDLHVAPDVAAVNGEKLFSFVVKDASRETKKVPYLIIEDMGQWRKKNGLPGDPYVDCGDRLRLTKGTRIPGIHLAYEYISGDKGLATVMHVEDGFLGSANVVLTGHPKIWLLVPPSHRYELEKCVRAELMSSEDSRNLCSQFVRHQNVLLAPELLQKWKIPYHVATCKAGEMIITLPGTYHQVVNAGPNYAQAINFAATSDWMSPPDEYRFCTVDCQPDGDSPITSDELRI